MVDRRLRRTQAERRRMGLVRRALGDVYAGDAVEIEPVTRELERRPVAGSEAENLAVEGLRRLEVVREHEHVLEPVERHQPRTFIPTIP
jgi:hypothetical protein